MCSGRDRPKPSAIGRSVSRRILLGQFARAAGHFRSHAGDAEPRDAIQESAARFRRLPDPLRRRRRAEQPDDVDARRRGRVVQHARFFDRQIEHEQAVDARFHGARDETIDAEAIDGIRVGEEDDGRGDRGADGSDQVERARQRHAARERALARALNHRAVSQRLRERHADLQHIGARAIERLENLGGLLPRRDRRRSRR